LSFKVAVDNPLRFTRSRIVGADLGLTPRRHQSGTSIDFACPIPKMGDINARRALRSGGQPPVAIEKMVGT
jgi:transposase